MVSTSRRRVQVRVMLDPDLLSVIDAFVMANPGTDRSAVIDDALRVWQERLPGIPMARQLLQDASRDDAERAEWRGVRDAAARRRLLRRK